LGPRPWSIGPTTRPDYFDLEDLEAVSGSRRELDPLALYKTPDTASTLYFAGRLRKYGADLLGGDLERIPLLEQRIRDRARSAAIRRLGQDRATSIGW
jgi:hypothetical protein